MSEGILIFHMEYTDIFNSLGLINYYTKKYDFIYLIIRPEIKKMIEYYTKDIENIVISYNENMSKDTYFNIRNTFDIENKDLLLHGLWDIQREDKYFDSFRKNFKNDFVEAFYTSYDIPSNIRYKLFEFNRDKKMEEEFYDKINPGEEYILVHKDEKRNLDFDVKSNYKIINLNKISEIFFDTIKLLENAKEIHCIDSVWGCLIYLLDMKYRLFENKKIYIYCLRKYDFIFNKPKLDNWIIL